RLEVGNAVVVGTGREGGVDARQRGQHGVAAGRATADAEPGGVGPPPVGQGACRGEAVGHVHDAPAVAQQLAGGTGVAGRAAVVDVDDRETTAGPVLNADGQH